MYYSIEGPNHIRHAYEKVAIHFTIQKLVRTRPQNLRFIQKCTGQPRILTNILLKQYEY